MIILHFVIFLLVAVIGTAVVFTRDPKNQVFVLGFYGMLLTLLFVVLQAPDVALSEIVVGSAALPLMLLVALANVQTTSGAARQQDKKSDANVPNSGDEL